MPVILHLQVNLEEANIPNEAEFQLWLDTTLREAPRHCERSEAIQKHRANTGLLRFARNDGHGELEGLEVNILLVDSEEGAQYNQSYRHKTGPTNVLSFPFEQPQGLDLPILGDIVLCAPVIMSEAKAQGKTLKAHYAHLTIHGCLHLCGFDHIKEEDAQQMEAIEVNILNKLEYSNPYENGETVDHA